MEKLSGKQARHLRGLGHHLKPVVNIGKNDLTEQLTAATDEALAIHELIKVKLLESCLSNRKEVAAELAAATNSAIAQVIGRTFLLYRPAEKPTIKLPKANTPD
jgi:RNA-binding protein